MVTGGDKGRVRKRWDKVGAPPTLRVVRADGHGLSRSLVRAGGSHGRQRRDYNETDYGSPSCQFRVEGEPIELRIWLEPPPPGTAAVLHPSGVWVAMRVV